MDIRKRFGERVRELRQMAGLSQEELAFEADIDRSYVSNIEKGKRNVSLVIIEKIANALNVSINELFN